MGKIERIEVPPEDRAVSMKAAPMLSTILEKDGNGKLSLWVCRGAGRGCPRNKYITRKVQHRRLGRPRFAPSSSTTRMVGTALCRSCAGPRSGQRFRKSVTEAIQADYDLAYAGREPDAVPE
jgi:hypothetical protein